MQVKIGGVTLKSHEITSPIEGLSKPKIRSSIGNFSGKDGGWLSSQFYSYREVVINCVINRRNCLDLDTERETLLSNLPIRQPLPFFITTYGGKTYYADVYVIDVQSSYESPLQAEYQITLVAPDPYLYDAGDGVDPDSGFIIQNVNKLVGGGYTFPYILPVEWGIGSTPTSVDNTSGVYIYPIITLNGKFTNPVIRNNTTGYQIELDITTGITDEIIIDMKNRTVTLNGGSILPFKSGSWWGLQDGVNMIQMY